MQSNTTKTKIFYIDNLRVLLTILVILHHTFISYGAPGGWYFTDKTTNEAALIFMTLFVATNQAFFMGFFFFLSALFSEPSYNKKGSTKFMADRLKRLGIPLLFYSFILSPLLNFLIYKFGYNKPATFIQYIKGYDDWIDPGVLWFVAALLLFTFIYFLIKKFKAKTADKTYSFPSNKKIFLFAFTFGVVSFVVRIFFPVGWVLHPVGFQFAHFTQYIAMFIIGLAAYRSNWLDKVNFKQGKQCLVIALILIFVVFPTIFILAKSSLDKFQGNGTWQSFTAALWEQLTGIAIMVAITAFAKYKWNYTTPLLQSMSRAAFATYIFHPLFVISICLLLKPLNIDPAFKLVIAAPIAVIASFSFAFLIVKIPVIKDIV